MYREREKKMGRKSYKHTCVRRTFSIKQMKAVLIKCISYTRGWFDGEEDDEEKKGRRVLNVNDYTLARMTQKINNVCLVPLTQM